MKNILDKSCNGNQNTYFTLSNVFPKIVRLWDKREKYRAAKEATDDNIIQQTSFAS
jgi:hypothetical protein